MGNLFIGHFLCVCKLDTCTGEKMFWIVRIAKTWAVSLLLTCLGWSKLSQKFQGEIQSWNIGSYERTGLGTWYVKSLVHSAPHFECINQQRIIQSNFARNFQDPRKKTSMYKSEPETVPPSWGREFDRSKAFQFCSSVEARY